MKIELERNLGEEKDDKEDPGVMACSYNHKTVDAEAEQLSPCTAPLPGTFSFT